LKNINIASKNANDFFENTRKIYDLLADTESKNIFAMKLLYNSTDSLEYINMMRKKESKNLKKKKFYNKRVFKLNNYLRTNNKQLVIYGLNEKMHRAYTIYNGNYLDIFGFCIDDLDSAFKKDNVPTISFKEILSNKDKYTVFIGEFKNFSQIKKLLIDNEIDYVKNKSVFNEGDKCKKIIKKVIKKLLPKNKFESLKKIKATIEISQTENLKQYFDPQIINFSNDEIFVDAGCLDLKTSKAFLHACKSVKKIYAFEPDPCQFQKCVDEAKAYEFIEVLPYALWHKKTKVNFACQELIPAAGHVTENNLENNGNLINIDAISLDDFLKGKEVTFIKTDIEGAELNALIGAEKTIRKYKPKLAICIYHKKQDIIDIPLYINSLNPEYKFYIRHYSDGPYDTVLYAI